MEAVHTTMVHTQVHPELNGLPRGVGSRDGVGCASHVGAQTLEGVTAHTCTQVEGGEGRQRAPTVKRGRRAGCRQGQHPCKSLDGTGVPVSLEIKQTEWYGKS